MSDTAKLRPRPRPRPKAKHSSPPRSSPDGAGTSIQGIDEAPLTVEEEDALFLRNRTRTSQTWKELDQLSKETKSRTINILDDSDNDEGTSTRTRRKHKAQPENPLPKWAKLGSIPDALSSDDDDDLEIIETMPNTKRGQIGAKRKRARSRSRSITPPPAVPIHQLQNAKNLVRQALDVAPRAASPTFGGDDSLDNIALDPELARIQEEIRRQPQKMTADMASEISGGPEVVIIRVKWRPHPLNAAGKVEFWNFRMSRHDTFRQIFDKTADAAAILSERLIMSYEGKRVFSAVTPQSLRIWADAELEACERSTYDYLQSNRHRSPSLLPDDDVDVMITSGDAILGADTTDNDESSGEQESIDKFRLNLRSAVTTQDIVLTVLPTTTCGAIVKAFLKKAGLADKYSLVTENTPGKKGKKKLAAGKSLPMLMVDGEKMQASVEIGTADLEDGDLVEVIGL